MWFERMGKWVAGKKTKWITLLVWIIVAAVLSIIWPGVKSMEQNNAQNLKSDMPSVQASMLAEEQFPSDSGIPALLVWHREGGISDEDLANIQQLAAYFTANPVEDQELVPPLDRVPLPALQAEISEDGSAFVFPFFFSKGTESEMLESGIKEVGKQAEVIFGYDPFTVDQGNENKISARVSGPAGISIDAIGLFSEADVSLMIATVLIVLVLLLLIYRSPILAIIPLIAVGFAYSVSSPVLGKMAEQGWITVDSQTISIMTVLLFGAGTDYCLFLISHFRQWLLVEKSKKLALIAAIKDSSGAIAMSGFTVVIALLVLLVSKYGAVHRFAVPFSLSILIMALASLTLVPALLAILGRGSFFPFIPRTQEMREDIARRKGKKLTAVPKKQFGGLIGKVVTKRPWVVVTVSLVILGAFALNSARIQYTYDLLSSFPENVPSREGFAVIEQKFTPGELAPVKLMVDTDGQNIALQDALQALPFIAKISEPVQGITNTNIQAVDIEFNLNPYSIEAMHHIPDIREVAEKALQEAAIASPDSKVWISGQTAAQYDTELVESRDAKLIIPMVIVLIALLLLVYLRSIIAMIYLILTVVLSYFSALGLGWIVLHDFMGAAAIQGLIPVYSFVFLVALGEDYNIFLISSIWKKRKTMPLKQAIQEGVTETGGVITSAGLILAGTFAVLATLPIQVLVQFGIITAIGVLLDTFVVRPFLVPAITMLLGKWAFWPGRHEEQKKRVEAEVKQ